MQLYPIFKRVFDILSSSIVLVVLLPFLIILMIVLRFTGEGEIFYKQERIGKENKPFNMLKFATMLKGSLNMPLGTTTIVNDPRVTRVGKILRKTKINELPQLFNVILGDISIVGPRPLPNNEFQLYHPDVQQVLASIRPGITGIGSVIFRDEEGVIQRNGPYNPKDYYEKVILPYKGELELWYSKNMSFYNDMKILSATVASLFISNSNIGYRFFKSLPKRPKNIRFD